MGGGVIAWFRESSFPWWYVAVATVAALMMWAYRRWAIERPRERLLNRQIETLRDALESRPIVGHVAEITLAAQGDRILATCMLGVHGGEVIEASALPSRLSLSTTTSMSELCEMKKSGRLNGRSGGWREQNYVGEIPMTMASRFREAIDESSGPASALVCADVADDTPGFSLSKAAASRRAGPDKLVRVRNWERGVPPDWDVKRRVSEAVSVQTVLEDEADADEEHR